MFKSLCLFVLFVAASYADLLSQREHKGATLKPLSVCCDIPELGDEKHLKSCSNPKPPGPCNDVQCVFEQSGFLTDNKTLNKDVYRSHLKKWEENHKEWTIAVEKAIRDCVDTEPRQHLDFPCKAYDVFTCTGIAMLKWAEIHKGWTDAVDTAIHDCVDTDLRQMLEDPCKAYDVFTCTGLAMTKKCPVKARKCYTIVTRYTLEIPNWS